MKKQRLVGLLLALTLVLSASGGFPLFAQEVLPGTEYTYTTADHWGQESDIWSWQWAPADSTDFQNMSYTYVEGQGQCYAADWATYPYCAARWGGYNVHPNMNADAARVFTAPADGTVVLSGSIARTGNFNAPSGNTPTSFRILLENTTVYPAQGAYQILTSTTPEPIQVTVKVRAGEKIRFVVGAMGNHGADGTTLQTTVTYQSVGNPGDQRVGQAYTFSATSATWGQPDPYWSWEWTPKNETVFSPMTYEYVPSYGRSMYVAGWGTYPYSYADLLGVKMHPALLADTVKTFTAPYTGTVKIDASVARYVQYVSGGAKTPTSLRILINETQVYPLYSSVLVLTDTQEKHISFSTQVRAGDKIRFVVGGMDQIDSDAIQMYNTVTYTSLENNDLYPGDSYTYQATAQTWGTDIPHWTWEWRDQNNTFGPMTYQYIASYGKYMYASDWATHTYNYADLLGVKVHPAQTRDTVKTFIAPYAGRVELQLSVERYVEYNPNSSNTPTSLCVFLNEEQIWPADGTTVTLTSTEARQFRISTDVQEGDKLRCVVGSMNNTGSDAIKMYNTVVYRAVGNQELAMAADQAGECITVRSIHADDWNNAETVWNWKPSTALGFQQAAAFSYPTDAKLRYAPTRRKHIVVASASRGFVGVIDYATGQKIWEVNATAAPNVHSVEYLPNGNVAAAASTGGWVRIYKASQNSTGYVQANLQGAHGLLWDGTRNLLWAVGDYVLTAYTVGGTAASPTLTEVTSRRVDLPTTGGHDLSPVHGNANRLWVSTNAGTYQFDISTATFCTDYAGAGALNHTAIKGISNYNDSETVISVYPNGTLYSWNSDRIFVTLPDVSSGKIFGRTLHSNTEAFYKIRSWVFGYWNT